jgi:hypothetical protein
MTPLSKLIFDQIAFHEEIGTPLTIRQVMGFDRIASPATIHRHLSNLRDSGYVFANSKNGYTRTKYLSLSSLGKQYVNSLSQAIIQAGSTT